MNTQNRLPTTDNRLKTEDQRLTTKTTAQIALCLWSLVFSLWSVAASAATYDIKEMTPAVQQALNSRKQRYSELQAAKQAGIVHENSSGLVSGAEPISAQENQDREVIYRTIAEQNNLGPEGLELVHRAFADVHRDRQ